MTSVVRRVILAVRAAVGAKNDMRGMAEAAFEAGDAGGCGASAQAAKIEGRQYEG